jgi:hypothetical protein
MRGKREVAARPRQAEIQVNPVAGGRGDRAMVARDMKRTPERQRQLRHSIAGEYRRLARSCQARGGKTRPCAWAEIARDPG